MCLQLQYVYILTGEELTRLVKDFIKFLFGGGKSVRLTKVMDKWKSFFEPPKEEEEIDRFWLEKAIIDTPTVYDSPEKFRRLYRPSIIANAISNATSNETSNASDE